MQPKRLVQWLALAALAILVLAGCAPRQGQGDVAAMEGADQLAVDLPALVIDIDNTGAPTVGGIPLAALAGSFGAAGLEGLQLPPDQVTTLVDANIQHLQINNTPAGLSVLVNGEAIPNLVWDGESLQNLQSLAEKLGDGAPPILGQILPVLGQVGIGVTVNFPLAQGAEIIPLEVTGADSAATTAAAQAAFVSSVATPAYINIPVHYAADGSWTVADMTDSEWIAITGQSSLESLRLSADVIKNLTAAGISEITVSTDEAGIHLAVDGQALPTVSWGDGKLNHAIDLAVKAGLLSGIGDGDADSLAAAIDGLLPMITSSQIELHVFLPAA